MTPAYRPDIDGLRAIAVLSIVLYHLGLPSFSGGFVGVDIFFVISGFLITSIIVRELAAGTFSIGRFYERRVRRILPALLVVVSATLLSGALLQSAPRFAKLGESSAATMVFVSNIFFYLSTGYFDGAAEIKPLLHTWSLAVEEQFYLLYPLVLLFITRYLSARYLRWLATLAVLSLLACVFMTLRDPRAAFFLFPFRAWELLLGGLLALPGIPALRGSLIRNLLGLAGIGLISVAVFGLSVETPFPGHAAMLPTVGTAMLIYAGAGGTTVMNAVLSIRPLVYIGLISYSLYLWHWPIVVFVRYAYINELGDVQKLVLLLVTGVISVLSWRFVEAPFRDRSRFGSRERVFLGAGLSSALLVVVGALITAKDGMPGRDRDVTFDDILIADPGWQHYKQCEEQAEESLEDGLCSLGLEYGTASFMLWGDSHGLALASAVNISARRAGASGLLAIRNSCPPLRGIDRRGRRSCHEFNESVLDYLASNPEIDTVILAGRWALATSGSRYKNEAGDSVDLEDVHGSDGGRAALVSLGLERTVQALGGLGKRVVIVAQVPEVGYDVSSAVFSARFSGRDVATELAPTIEEFLARTADSRRIIERLAADTVDVVDPASRLCGAVFCRIIANGRALYRDDNHLSLRGAIYVSSTFDPVFHGDNGDQARQLSERDVRVGPGQ